MDKTTQRHQSIIAALLFVLALEELILYSSSQLASWAVSVVLVGLIYWLIAVDQ